MILFRLRPIRLRVSKSALRRPFQATRHLAGRLVLLIIFAACLLSLTLPLPAQDSPAEEQAAAQTSASTEASDVEEPLGETPEVDAASPQEMNPERMAEAAGNFLHVISAPLRRPLVLCFFVIATGMGLGSVRLAGLSLGTSGVLFAGLLLGHFGLQEGWKMPDGVGTLGLILFVYAVGLGAGPTFFRTFKEQGKQLAILAIVTVVTGAVTVSILAWLWGIPGDLATGIFAGALTSTPALASGIEAATAAGKQSLAVSIGYGMAYPVGVVAVVLFVQLLPRLLRINVDRVGRDLQRDIESTNQIGRHLVQISNPAVFGENVSEMRIFERVNVQITRVLEGEQLVPIKPGHVLQEGQVVLLVTDASTAEMLTMLLGRKSDARVVIDSDRDRADVVVTSPTLADKPLRALHLRSRFGVTISRVERFGVDFVPNANSCLSMGDRVTAVGEPKGLKAFELEAGHRIRRLHETDLMSAGFGLVAGILIGMIPISLPGGGSFTLGLAGGPLLAGLLFAHFGRFMGLVGYMPIAARMLTQQLGLAMFLAAAGYDAGGHLLQMLDRHGATPFLLSIAVAVVSISVAVLFAKFVLKMNLLQILGGTCGAMTSTAGIGALMAKTDCDIPVSSYAAAYPSALVAMTILAQLLMTLAF